MGTIALVGPDIDGGRRALERFVADGNPVRSAYWSQGSENRGWSLNVSTPVYDERGPRAAYEAILASVGKLSDSFNASELRLVGVSDPVALEVVARIAGESPDRMYHWQDPWIRGSDIADILVYPARYFEPSLATAMTGEDIGREIVRIMRKSASPLLPPRVTLRDNTHFDGNPIALQLGTGNAPIVQFIVTGENLPRVVPLDDIASIV